MMSTEPVFAIVGHPNEGKSSVISTLAEDDSVSVSAYPGETIVCQRFPVKVNGKKVLEFIDTPGFQHPRKVLQWMESSGLTDDALLDAFFEKFGKEKDYHHDCELMKPIRDGAGVIYVVDCSRPLLPEDEAEMEILRLVNRPRMAVINFKDNDREYLEEWKTCFRRHFNVIREFNAHQAKFAERIALFETLKAIQQDWAPFLSRAIEAFKSDWNYRKKRVVEMILDYIEEVLNYRVSKDFGKNSESTKVQEKLLERYKHSISEKERKLFGSIKTLYRHHVFDFRLHGRSLLTEDLFSERTWQLLGLTEKQMLLAATGTGAGLGAALDVAAAGITFGVFTVAGAVLGGGSAWLKGKELAEIKIKHLPLGGSKLTVGPNKNPQFAFVSLERALLFYEEFSRHAHARRTQPKTVSDSKSRFTDKEQNAKLISAFKRLQSKNFQTRQQSREQVRLFLEREMAK